MEEASGVSWWQTALRGVAILLGLAALSGLLMGGIMLVARFLDKASLPTSRPAAVFSDSVPAAEQNARTRVPMPYAPLPWPDSPGRQTGYGSAGASAGGNGNSAPTRPSVPVGIPVDEYRATVAAGKKVYLPNPQGKCDLSGTSATASVNSLESCFASQAAR